MNVASEQNRRREATPTFDFDIAAGDTIVSQIRSLGILLLASSMLLMAAGVRFAAAAPANAPPAAGKSDETTENLKEDVVLFRKAIDENRDLIVVRSAMHPVADIRMPDARGIVRPSGKDSTLQEPGNSGLIDGCYSVILQVVHGRSAPLTLAARPFFHHSAGPSSGEIVVWDVLVDHETFVVAIGTWKIRLWRFVLFAQDGLPQMSDTALSSHWTGVALASHLDRQSVSVKLSLLKDGRIQADVDDLRAHRQTRYLQNDDEWKFAVVSTNEKNANKEPKGSAR